ncbi:class I SAM-dependent RNA methyltransferase [Demequina mangrovi]|uniref:23S rRNA m(5)U-1939 methyltransferase n=1 Tax=Demequina mangrovi TaxID=1043493 RepID=A0A1H6UDD7_9MICO|nr:TRAM domain-containing protein [Demequina mangrovi]SEI88654.1 23S rRNA m(5)U-1939 methyltransferase [Demequina mangrovi]
MRDLLTLEIGAVAHGGHCVARHEGRVVFVRHTLPGEVVRARLTEAGDDARLWRADAVEILEASPDRVASAWPDAGPGGVGGGELAHVSLPAQRRWKHDVLREAFTRFADMDFPGEVAAAPGDDERGGLGYRTRVTVVAGPDGRAAMHVHRSRAVKALDSLPIAAPALEELVLGTRFPAASHIQGVAPAGEEPRLVVDGTPWKGGRPDRRDNAPRRVRESVTTPQGEWSFQVDVEGFWQVHRAAPAVLVDAVLSRIGDAETVLDLYAGAGLFTVPLASSGRSVTSVESDARASRDARRNAHDVPSASIVHADTRAFLDATGVTADAVVLDPPRSGAGGKTIDVLAKVGASRLIYVACDPVALARDTALLAAHGYVLEEAQGLDLFPMTHHIETVATFVRS